MGNKSSSSSTSQTHHQQQKQQHKQRIASASEEGEYEGGEAAITNRQAEKEAKAAAQSPSATKREIHLPTVLVDGKHNHSFRKTTKKAQQESNNKKKDLLRRSTVQLQLQQQTFIKPALKYSLSSATLNNSSSANESPLLKQTSTWSLGSLRGHRNLSFHESVATADGNRNSFRHRNKSTRKSLTALQLRRSKTAWHRPLTNSIFNSHFKDNSRNEQFHVDHLIAKGAFGVVFKVIDNSIQNDNNYHQQYQKRPTQPLQQQQHHHNLPISSNTNTINSYAPVYALKVLKKSKIIQDQGIQQLKDEVDIQKLCGHHPFIVQQIDLWQNRHNLHILSEYIPNGELFSRVAHFSLDLIRLYLAEIALAIDFLHNAGIIYRDAKPENILLTETFHLKLTDFGLSKWLKLGANTKTMCGTFQYMGRT